jgi:hypothetical protein
MFSDISNKDNINPHRLPADMAEAVAEVVEDMVGDMTEVMEDMVGDMVEGMEDMEGRSTRSTKTPLSHFMQ